MGWFDNTPCEAEPMKQHAVTLTGELMDAIRSRIATRVIGPGDRLPSVRAFAETMGASPSTVVEAYDRLAAEGLIRARRGSGFYVTGTNMPPLSIGEMGPRRDRAIDPFWVSRQSLDADATMEKPGCGWLPADWMPDAALRRGLRGIARADTALLSGYGSTRGSLTLRRLLLGRFADEGIEADTDQLLLTGSGTQAIDLVCRYLLHPGDTVLVDDPGYFNFQALLRAHRVELVGVPYTQAGPDVAAFEAALTAHRPRLYITNSAVQNPTGATLSATTAHRILKIAEAHDMVIVEDDIFADFEDQPSPRYAAFDGLDRVIRIGSFSKSLSSTVRLGYVAARPEWITPITDLRIATAISGSMLSARLVNRALSDGSYRRHMDRLRTRLSRCRQQVELRLAEIGVLPWTRPASGMFLWCRLPGDADAAEVARRGLEAGIVFAPGNVFSAGQAWGSYMRFNAAMMGDERIYDVLARALRG